MGADYRVLRTAACGRAIARIVTVLALFMALASGASTAHAADALSACGGTVTPAPEPSRQINLVVDDSSSMFFEDKAETQFRDRWSFAKYSVEVFAGLLGANDVLNVYRLSDHYKVDPKQEGPSVTVLGADPLTGRVASIHELPLEGRGTPFAPVETAFTDLQSGSAQDKWLVVLTDGTFDGQKPGELDEKMREYAGSGAKVAFLSLGDGAATITADEAGGIFAAQAARAEDLLAVMTGFSNRLFQRAQAPQGTKTEWTTDVAMSEVVVFAQGADVTVGPVQTANGPITPESTVDVSWAPNTGAGKQMVASAPPNTSLKGVIATYKDLPAGTLSFDIQNASTIDYFYKPQVNFGVILRDASGAKIDQSQVREGEPYTIEYGFMDANCEIVQSSLLGDVTYTAELEQEGKVVKADFKSGDVLNFPAGGATLQVAADYLKGSRSQATIDLKVGAGASTIASTQGEYLVSTMTDFPPAEQGLQLQFYFKETAGDRAPTPEEWVQLDPATIQISSPSNLEFTVLKEPKPGRLTLLPRAPDGDVYAADTGPIEVTLSAPPIGGAEQGAVGTFTFTVIDDISASDRWLHWLIYVGLKWLLVLLLLVILAGYLFKRRFPKKVRKRPTVTGIPRSVGTTAVNSYGKFRVNGGRRLLPFLADTATLSYVPAGVLGFSPLKLKAGPSKTMIVTNWRVLARKGTTEINGNVIDESTTKAPSFSASAIITANTPQMTYELTPNQ